MRATRTLLPLLVTALLIGCVSSNEYKARLADIEDLKQNVNNLEEQLGNSQKEREELKGELDARYQRVIDLESQVQDISVEKETALKEKEKALAELKKTYNDLMSELNQEIQAGQIVISQLKDRLSLSMVEKILFDSGSAKIKENGKKVLNRVGEILAKVTDKQINIEGHTDNVPINPSLQKGFPTNWELSTARASNVVRYLQENTGMNPDVLSAVGYAEFRPVASNETHEGRAKNRRIEIVLVPLLKTAPEAEMEEAPTEPVQE